MADVELTHGEPEDSDYGSDFSIGETEIVYKLLTGTDSKSNEVLEDNPIVNEIEYHGSPETLRIPRVLGQEKRLYDIEEAGGIVNQSSSLSVLNPDYPDLSKVLPQSQESPEEAVRSKREDTPAVDEHDVRPPIERWRTRPRKAFSVTDLVSPSWCELQYFYTLKYHGKKRRTAAMKQGSVVHQTLEDQLYTTVQVEIESKEDAWGLRIWNVIQGLRTLQESGQTRELEVWGTIDGQVVNGVIDELSYICPDVEMEEKVSKKDKDAIPADQATISDFFKASGSTSISSTMRTPRRSKSDRLYLCDVKTRGGRSLPTGSALRPTQYQLMVYHHLLSNLAGNKVDFTTLMERYALDAYKPFSDSFIAQIGSLNDNYPEPSPGNPPASSQDSITTLLTHNSLRALWEFMIETFATVIPSGRASLGNVLKAEYRSRETGEILGRKTFPMDDAVLQRYISTQMEWWKGERPPKGVVVEEAFKCRSCDFADTCQWRLEKLEEDKARAKVNQSSAKNGQASKISRGRVSIDGEVVETKIP